MEDTNGHCQVVNATAAGTTDEASGVNFDADNVEFDITYGHVHVTVVAAAGNHPVVAKST